VNSIAFAAGVIAAEVRAAEKEGDPEWLAGAAMCYVQARVRPWREAERIAAGYGFTTLPATILSSESGYCGSCVLVWRGILHEHGIETQQLCLSWTIEAEPFEVGHVCGEAFWGDGWHFFDVMTGTLWYDSEVLAWEQVRLNPDEKDLRVSNEASIRYTGFESWFADDPFAYLHVEPLEIEYVE
jgi:hypothetical protein